MPAALPLRLECCTQPTALALNTRKRGKHTPDVCGRAFAPFAVHEVAIRSDQASDRESCTADAFDVVALDCQPVIAGDDVAEVEVPRGPAACDLEVDAIVSAARDRELEAPLRLQLAAGRELRSDHCLTCLAHEPASTPTLAAV